MSLGESSGTRRRAAWWALLGVAATINLSVIGLYLNIGFENGHADFKVFHAAARVMREQGAEHVYSLAAQGAVQDAMFPNMPTHGQPNFFERPIFELVLFLPLTDLAPRPAYFAWFAANLVALLGMMWLLRPWLDVLRCLPWPALALLPMAWAPNGIGLNQGQDAIVLSLLVAFTYVALRKGWPVAAGALLALGGFKPHIVTPLALVLFLGQRYWRSLASFAATGVALLLLSVGMAGTEGARGFLQLMELTGQPSVNNPAWMLSLWGLAAGSLPLSSRSAVTKVVTVISIGLVAVAIRVCSRSGESKTGLDLTFAIAAVTAVLVCHSCYAHNLSLLFPALLVLWNLHRQNGGYRVVLAMGAVLSSWPIYLLTGLMLHQLTIGLLVMYAGLLYAAKKEGRFPDRDGIETTNLVPVS